jgi:hypothetical protein
MKGLLKDAAGFLITAQVGILGIVAVAVRLVTLITQRDGRSSNNIDIQLYYAESLAYPMVSSSLALLIVLSIQISWPLQFELHWLGPGSKDLIFKVLITGIHVGRLSINLSAFAQFIITSLNFVEPSAREELRETFTANSVLPADLFRRLLLSLYMNAPKTIFPSSEEDSDLYVAFGFSPLE